MRRPTLTVIAGANGAGKSTLTAGNPGIFAAIPLLDPDAFANTLRSSGTGISAMAAGKEVLRLAKEPTWGTLRVFPVTLVREEKIYVPEEARTFQGRMLCCFGVAVFRVQDCARSPPFAFFQRVWLGRKDLCGRKPVPSNDGCCVVSGVTVFRVQDCARTTLRVFPT